MLTQAKQMKRQTRGKAEPVASEGLKSTGMMGYQKSYHLFSEDWLQEKQKKVNVNIMGENYKENSNLLKIPT